MVISSDKSNIVRLIGLWVIVVLASLLFAQVIGIVPALSLLVCSTVVIALYYVVISRVIIMSENSCKISLWSYSKEYTWDEISIKRIESSHLGLRNPYHLGGAFFSVRRTKKPVWLDPALYCTFFHPVSCFFVYFVSRDACKNAAKLPGIYEVDKQIFIKQLQLWGISLDE